MTNSSFHVVCRADNISCDKVAFHFLPKAKPLFHYFWGSMSENLVLDLSMQFAIDIVTLCEELKGKNSLNNQLLRAGTSIGANIHEANYAASKADFIAKLQIALKECYETEYWLKLFVKTNLIKEETYSKLINDSGKIRRILISSLNTAKANA